MNFDNYCIRFLESSDLQAYYELVERNRRRLEDFFTGTTSRTKTFEETTVFLAELMQQKADKAHLPFVVVDKSSDMIVAYISLKNIDWSIPKAEIGFYTDESYAGKGMTTKAFLMILDYCLEEFAFKKLFLRTHPENFAARKMAEKCGFEVEGIIRRDYKKTSGEVVDLVYYGRIC